MTTTVDYDPYELDDGTSDLDEKFKPSLMSRARKRTVTAHTSDSWSVHGDPALDDTRDHYLVSFIPGTSKYDCACYHSDHGITRQRRLCSHVLAVIIFRRSDPNNPLTATPTTDTLTSSPEVQTTEARENGSLPLPGADTAPAVSVPSLRDPIFGAPPVPARFKELRAHQWAAVEEIVEAFKSVDLVWLDAPTGSGKTLIGEVVRRMVTDDALYVCSSIQLQRQMTTDFDYAREIKGRSNYTPLMSDGSATCADCTSAPPESPACFWCPDTKGCPYTVAKRSALGAKLAVLNTSYWLHVANYTGEFTDRPLVVIDETDVLESELMGFVEVSISDRVMREHDLGLPLHVTKPEAWKVWLDDVVIPRLTEAYRRLHPSPDDLQGTRKKKSLGQLIAKLSKVTDGVTDGNWVFDDYKQGRATFRPVRVDGFGGTHLWAHGKKFLCMSATIISPDQMAQDLGWEKDHRTVRVPHTFPVENRRVHVAPVANMTAKGKVEEYPKMANAIINLAHRHADERTLIHCVSYDLMNYLADALKKAGLSKRVLTYKKASERESVLAKFRRTHGGILIAPSMDRGVDLPGDDCDVIIVAKVPFPSLGNKQVNARLYSHHGNTWYAVQTVRSLVQMCGRAVRSSDDQCVTYLLDAQFPNNIWRKHRHLIPNWFKEALDWSFPARSLA